jgi:hypothetical protein
VDGAGWNLGSKSVDESNEDARLELLKIRGSILSMGWRREQQIIKRTITRTIKIDPRTRSVIPEPLVQSKGAPVALGRVFVTLGLVRADI